MEAIKVTTEQPELAERFNRVLGETVEALEEAGLHYAFIGGIASGGLGRPRSTHDIDVFVRPEDAELTLRALAKRGFRTEKTDPSWLYKGFKENILVDVIFKSKGEIYLDNEMYQRSIKAEFHGKQLRLVAPEDLLIIKASAHSEQTPGHWHDALALLSHANINWDYLIRRARRAPRRLLSLLIYAHSNDIWVPKHVIDELFRAVYGGEALVMSGPQTPMPSAAPSAQNGKTATPLKMVHKKGDNYAVAHLREKLASDPRCNELDIQIEHRDGKFLLRGETMTPERREAVVRVVKENFSDVEIENQIRVTPITEPVEAEEVK